MLLKARSLDDLNAVAESLIALFDRGYVVALLNGELGSGKTTLVKVICQELGVMTPVSSPTFSIVQEYESPSRGTIYHMDFYRLETQQELEQIGFSEYLDSGNICLIEWPDLGKAFYTMPFITVDIEMGMDNIRTFKILTHDEVDA